MQTDTKAGTKGGVWEFSRKRRLMNRAGSIVKNPHNIMVVISVIFMVYLILISLGQMIIQTLTLAGADAARVDGGREGVFTPYYWKRVLTSSISWKMLWTSPKNFLLISVCTAAFGIILGSLLAWLMVRSDPPYEKFFSLALIIPYMIPSWCRPMAWLTIFKNKRAGGAQSLLGLLGVQTPDWLAYGPFAIIVVPVIRYYAYAYLLVSSALSSINSELGETGEILGANKARILTKITFPLVMPAILSAVIMTFLKATGAFGVPSVLGLKIGYYTISTTMYNSIQNGQNRAAFAISLILIAIASFSVFLNQKAIGSKKSPSTIGGKGSRSNLMRLDKWRPAIVGILTTSTAVAVVPPVVILLCQSFMPEPSNCSLSNFILHYWTGGSMSTIDQGEPGIFKNPQSTKYVVDTIKLVVPTSLFATVLGQLIGHINSRGRKLFSGKLVEQLVFVPYLIPPVAFGVMYLALFATVKKIEMFGYRIILVLSLYGFLTLLALIAVVKNMPLASRAGTSNMLQISTELEETAQVENARPLRRFFEIVFPLPKGGMINGFMLVFVSIMKELDLIVIPMTSSQQMLPYMTYAYLAENLTQLSSAMTIVMFVLAFSVYWFANTFTDADITRGL